jgi:transcription initiation factor TFIIIB Brf1 subunit/transcription initiation factor TFIIB
MHQYVNEVDVENYHRHCLHHKKTNGESNFSRLVESINLPDDVRQTVMEIYHTLNTPIKRGRNRLKLLYYCVLKAYYSLGMICNPDELATKLGLNRNEISSALKLGSMLSNRGEEICYSPLDFLQLYAYALNLDVVSVLDTGRSILERNPHLNDNFPQVVACAILLVIYGKDPLLLDNVCCLSGRSPTTICKVCDTIKM